MALRAIIDDLDGLSAELAELYTPHGDKFILAIESVDGYALEDVGGLKSSLAKERSNARKANEKLAAFGDIDPTAAAEALTKVGEMANWTPDEKVREQIQAREKQLVEKHAKDLEKLNGEMGDVRSQLEGQLIKAAAVQAVAEHGGSVELLMPHIERQTKLEMVNGKYVAQVIDENGVPRVSMKPGSVDGMSIGELVESMRDMDAFAPAFAGSGASGSGSAGSNAAGSSGKFSLSFDEAHDPQRYRDAKAAAEKAGGELQISPFQQPQN